jgi:hypothetical protein
VRLQSGGSIAIAVLRAEDLSNVNVERTSTIIQAIRVFSDFRVESAKLGKAGALPVELPKQIVMFKLDFHLLPALLRA